MPITFKNAPLAELVAELRWSVAGGLQLPVLQPGVMQQVTFNPMRSSSTEEFFMRFGARVHANGFSATERIFPPGFPSAPYQVVYRYKRVNDPREILQVGPGVFTANAVKPYQSWHIFRPSVEQGIDALLASRSAEESELPFNTVALRYINTFGQDLTGGRSPQKFMREVLGYSVAVPDALREYMKDGEEPNPNVSIGFPSKDGQQVTITVAEGSVEGASCVLLDTTVTSGVPTGAPIPPDREKLIVELNRARDMHHKVFLRLTSSIGDAMKPEGRDE